MRNRQVGILEAGYLEAKPGNAEVSFLEDEIKLLNAIAERLGRIIERKEAEEKLIESHNLRKLFIDILIHDLMNPLTIINGTAIMLGESELDHSGKKRVEMILHTVKRMHSLTTQAIEFVKLQEKDSLKKKEIDLNNAIQQVITDFSQLAAGKKIGITFVNTSHFRIEANEIINQVFTNLLSNAIKYSPENTAITISIEKSGENCRIYFRDQGEGVPAESKDLIFTRFERLHKGFAKGSGLGLAISKTIVALHHGAIWVEDNPGGGSAFIVEIPVRGGTVP